MAYWKKNLKVIKFLETNIDIHHRNNKKNGNIRTFNTFISQ